MIEKGEIPVLIVKVTKPWAKTLEEITEAVPQVGAFVMKGENNRITGIHIPRQWTAQHDSAGVTVREGEYIVIAPYAVRPILMVVDAIKYNELMLFHRLHNFTTTEV